jgi:hypothetical protein
LIDLFLQILEDVRVDVSRGLWFSHSGVHHTLKADKREQETRNALLWKDLIAKLLRFLLA